MIEYNLRYTKLPLSYEAGAIPALGFGTLIPDPIANRNATQENFDISTLPEDAMKEISEGIKTRHVLIQS